ncbi:MAG: hypothetical protein ACJ79R_19555 [Anaeromyxobacteraceae bacterium]
MAPATPVMMLCTYRPKKGKERRLRAILERHWTTLRDAGLVDPEVDPGLFRGTNRRGEPCFVETFAWKSARAAGTAHETPAVMALWGPIGELAEEMDFIEIEPLSASRPPRRSRPSSPRARRA